VGLLRVPQESSEVARGSTAPAHHRETGPTLQNRDLREGVLCQMKNRVSHSLYVRQAGPADAPPIVFVHGQAGSGAMWQPQFERLPDFHCLAPDLPEHGHSANVAPFSLKDAAQRVATLIRQVPPHGRAHVVGLSMGAAVIVQMLSDVPEVIDHALISGAPLRLHPALAALNIRWAFVSPEQLAAVLFSRFHIPKEYRHLLYEGVRLVKPTAFLHFAYELTQIQLPHQAPVPTLITVGEKEAFAAKYAAHRMKMLISGAKGAMVMGVGHIWSLEAADLFAQTVRAWVTDAPLPPALLPF
jgi:pimeloyl-ACP methyl ester carboxylesterase